MKTFGRAGSTFGTVVAAAVVLAFASTAGAVAGGLVTSAKIKNNTIKSIDVRDNNLTGVDVADGSLGGADVADGSLGAADLGGGTVTAAKLGTIVVRSDQFDIPDNDGQTLSVSCLPGERIISGGASTAGVGISAGWTLIKSAASGNGWVAVARNQTGSTRTLVVEAYCLQ